MMSYLQKPNRNNTQQELFRQIMSTEEEEPSEYSMYSFALTLFFIFVGIHILRGTISLGPLKFAFYISSRIPFRRERDASLIRSTRVNEYWHIVVMPANLVE